MSADIKETAVSAIQRDRLSEFLKNSYHEGNGACFYYSIIGAFNSLYPGKAVPKKLEEHIFGIVKKNRDFALNSSEFISEITNLEDLLRMRISQVDVLAGQSSVEEAKNILNIPENIPVIKIDNPESVEVLNQNSTAILFMQTSNQHGHYIHISKNITTYESCDRIIQSEGGQKEYDEYVSLSYFPTAVFHLTKIEQL